MAGINNYPGFLSDFVRGTTKDFTIRISKNGEPVDITGSKFVLTISTQQKPDNVPDLEIVIDPPTHPTEGSTTGRVTDSQTFALSAGTYYYSIRYVNSLGHAYVIDMGKIRVYEAVSNIIE